MKNCCFFFTLFFLTMMACFELSAKEVPDLFTKVDGKYIAAFNYIPYRSAANLDEGDILTIGEYKFRYKRVLGRGNVSVLFAVEIIEPQGKSGEYALRLPLGARYYNREKKITYRSFIAGIAEGFNALNDEGIRSSNVEFAISDVAIVHKLETFTDRLSSFLQNPYLLSGIVTEAQMEEDFLKFAESTYLFSQFSDFKIDQLVYDANAREWILLDWGESHKKIHSLEETSTIFDSGYFLKSLRRVYDISGDATYGADIYEDLDIDRMNSIIEKAKIRILKKREKQIAIFQDKVTNFLEDIVKIRSEEEYQAYKSWFLKKEKLTVQESLIFLDLVNIERGTVPCSNSLNKIATKR